MLSTYYVSKHYKERVNDVMCFSSVHFLFSYLFSLLFVKDEKAHPRMKQKNVILWHDYECDFGGVPCAPDIGGHVGCIVSPE